MDTMTTSYAPDSLHRLIKEALDTGAARSVEEAEKLYRGYRLGVAIHDREAATAAGQIAVLTLVALARRVFLGGVDVHGDLDHDLKAPLPLKVRTLGDAIVSLGGTVAHGTVDLGFPMINVGWTDAHERHGSFHVCALFSGWRGGIVPCGFSSTPEESPVMPLSPMLAAALAVNEAFLHIRGETPEAGRRAVGLSLWNPSTDVSWLDAASSEPEVELLPSRLWMLGLGHLGQAYLWALGILPYSERQPLELVLQDMDIITKSTESTSILSDTSSVGLMKTRAMAAWAERRGFVARIQERRFTDLFRREGDEPNTVLCGLDNALGRRALDGAGFDLVVEAGLGRGAKDFRTLRLHTLPSTRASADIWREGQAELPPVERPAYTELQLKGLLDKCGITLLAGKAVGAPFVGATAATLVVAELLRHLHEGGLHQLMDIDLLALEHRTVVRQQRDFSGFNPGFVRSANMSSDVVVSCR